MVDSKVEYILRMTGNAMSITCFCGVLLTYALFTELHTKAGERVIALNSFLLSTCIFQILSFHVYTNKVVCISVAIAQQWTYMMAFSLTLVISIDIYKTFGNKHFIRNEQLYLLHFVSTKEFRNCT